MRCLSFLAILFILVSFCSSEATVTLERMSEAGGCILDCRVWAVADITNPINNGDPNLGATNAHQGAWLAGNWNMNDPNGQPPVPSNGIINLRFQFLVAPSICNLVICDYTCDAEYYNRENYLQSTTNYPTNCITRTCSDDWYSFHPGWSDDTNAWVITDNTVAPNDLMAGLRGKIRINIISACQSIHTATFEADVAFMGGYCTRVVTAGGSFTASVGGEYYVHYEPTEWDTPSRTETVSHDWENVTWNINESPVASGLQHRAARGWEHEDAFRILTAGTGSVINPEANVFLLVNGSVTDKFGTSTASIHVDVSLE